MFNRIISRSRRPRMDRLVVRTMLVARVAWPIYVALMMSIFIAALQVRYLNLTNPPAAVVANLEGLGLSVPFYAFFFLGFEVLFVLGFIVVGAIIYARNSDDWIGVFTAYTLVTFGMAANPITVTLQALEHANPAWQPLVRILSFMGWAMMVFFFYLFPDGRFVPSRARYWVIVTVLLVQVPWNIFREAPFSPWQWPAEWHITALLLTWLPAWCAQFLRYRHNTDPVKAQQTKWFVYGSVVAVISAFGFHIPRVIDPGLNDSSLPGPLIFQFWSAGIVYLSVLLMPIGIGISIMRYRLWDIDLIISKTLVYVPLTGILAGLYAASIRIFQGVFESLFGAKTDIAVVMTTLVLASTFTPIKNALQNAVDKRFKAPPDPSEELQQLAGEMRLFVEMNNPSKIMRRVMEDIVQAFGAAGGAVYMLHNGELTLTHTYADWDEREAVISAPVECDGQVFGEIKLSHRVQGDDYSEQDQKTLQETVGLLACTLQVSR